LTKKIASIIKLIRPLNFVITFLSVIVAVLICQPDNNFSIKVIMAALAASFVLASGNIINDIYDVEIDKINQPQRPLASGSLSKSSAIILYFVLTVVSIGLSYFSNMNALVIVITTTFLLFLYSKYLKRVTLVGNIVVAFLTAFVFIYGGIVVENPEAAVIPAVFAFLINFIREMVKDMQDVKGDEKAGVLSFPIKYGFQKTKMLSLVVIILLILFTFYPFITHLYKIEYFIFVMVIVNPILIYCMKILSEDQSSKNLNKISNLLKLSMVFGLIAIFLGV
jgi:geranylgeranylglycerol-phosphate geranylgeranyltransferase